MAVTPIEELRAAVQAAAADLGDGATAPSLERPRKAGFGDFSTNAAMLMAPALKAPPREIAEKLGAALTERLGEQVDRVEVAGPGFLNIFLADAWYTAAAAQILAAGDAYGGNQADPPEKIQVEFISANPTGPLTAASGRHGAYGDALRRLLSFMGNEVESEYYFNDAGGQIDRLALSIQARARGEDPPEDGYQGDYVQEIADAIPGAADMPLGELAPKGVALVMERIRATLEQVPDRVRRLVPGALAPRGRPEPGAARLRAPGRAGHDATAPTARCGCAPAPPATTRTA